MIQVFQTWQTQNKRLLVLIVSFLLISAMLFWFWQRTRQAEEQYRQAVVLQHKQLEQAQELGKALHIAQMNAKELQAAYDALKAKPSAASFTVTAPSLEVAAHEVAEKINKQDATLPPTVLEKTERTAVVKNDEGYKVDVLKINLDKSWELSAGVGSHRGDVYIPLGLQRNYAPHKAVAAEVHLVPETTNISGWEVKHVWRY